MRARLTEHSGTLALVVSVAVAVSMLLLLSWGISTGNLVAAMVSGAFLAIDIVLSGSVVMVPDNLRSQATERTLRLASSTLAHMRDGLTPENCTAVCQLLLPETQACAISMTDTESVLAFVGDAVSRTHVGSPNTAPTE